MSISIHDIEQFREFALGRLATGGDALDLVQLAAEWQFRHETDSSLRDDARAVKAALRDMHDGKIGRPFGEFVSEFRNQTRREIPE